MSVRRAWAGLSPGLRWGLVVTVLGSAWALRLPQGPAGGGAVVPPTRLAPAQAAAPGGGVATASAAMVAGAASAPTARQLDPAERDPFAAGLPPPTPLAQAVAAPLPVPTAAPVAEPRTAPPVAWPRYFGRLAAPSGERLVFVQAGDKVLPVTVGQALPGDVVVDAVTTKHLSLRHAASGDHWQMPLPAEDD